MWSIALLTVDRVCIECSASCRTGIQCKDFCLPLYGSHWPVSLQIIREIKKFNEYAESDEMNEVPLSEQINTSMPKDSI